MINETATLLLNATKPYDAAKVIVQHHPFPLIALVLVPLLGLLFAGLATKTIGKGNFWAIFTIAFFSEVVAILLFLFLITI